MPISANAKSDAIMITPSPTSVDNAMGMPPTSVNNAMGMPPTSVNNVMGMPPTSVNNAMGMPPTSVNNAMGMPPTSVYNAMGMTPTSVNNAVTPAAVRVQVENAVENTNEMNKTGPLDHIGNTATDGADDPFGFGPLIGLRYYQFKVMNIIENIYCQAIIVLLILLDFILVIVVLASDSCAPGIAAIEIVSHIIISLFLLEIAARIFSQGKEFFFNCYDVIDMIVVVTSFIVDMVFIGIEVNQSCIQQGRNFAKLVVIGRVFRIIRILRIIYLIIVQERQIAKATRKVVSKNKRRYQRDGFDLDLCYITERVIAMAYPSKGVFMSFYRNPIREVARFFDTKHKDHYKIYNLCSESEYDKSFFHDRVERVYIDDHNVPRLRDIVRFTDNVRQWLSADVRNIIAIHCKGGKGRTGTMVCCWLVDSGLFEEAAESLDYFGGRRTDLSLGNAFQGVETPSQSRYVSYYEKLKTDFGRKLPPNKYLRIKSVKIKGLEYVGKGDGSDLGMEIRPEGDLIWECQFGENQNCETKKYSDNNSIVELQVELKNSPVIEGDIQIIFRTTSKLVPIGNNKCPFYFWFYTSFIEDNTLYLPRDELDNPHKKKVHKVFREHFAIELKFEDVDDSEIP